MKLKDLWSGFGESSIMKGIPYRISRALFFSFAVVVVLFVAFIYLTSNSKYLYSECPTNPKCPLGDGCCINSYYGSKTCDDVRFSNLSVCTTEYILVDNSTGVGSVGVKPPWYIAWYTFIIIASYFFVLIINTFLFNRHLFTKEGIRKAIDDRKKLEEDSIIHIGDDGEVVNDGKKDNCISKDSEGIVSDSTIHPINDEERESSGCESEVKSSEKSGPENGVQSNVSSVGNKTDRRFRKRNSNNGVPPIN